MNREAHPESGRRKPNDAHEQPLGELPQQRSRGLALLLPKRQDLIKALLPLAAGAWAILATAGVGESVRAPIVSVIAFVVVFELVLYQGRYLVNDLIDADTDQDDVHRNRYPWRSDPQGPRYAVGSLVVRALIIVGALILLPDPVRSALLVSVLAVIAVSYVYERFLRGPTRILPTEQWVARPGHSLIYLWIGLGYAIRVAAPVWIIFGQHPIVLAAFAYGAAQGSMFVTMTWGLEATVKPPAKAHVNALAFVPQTMKFSPFNPVLNDPAARSGMWDGFLQGQLVGVPLVALAVAFGATGAVGPAVLAGALGGAAWFLRSNVWVLSGVVGLSAAALALALHPAGSYRMVAAAAALIVVLVVYLIFRHKTYSKLTER